MTFGIGRHTTLILNTVITTIIFPTIDGCLLGNQKMQTCVNCKPASDCKTITAARLTSTADECKYWCSIGRFTCRIAYRPHKNCMMFAEYHCNSVVEEAGEKVFRLTCASDCLEYTISSMDQQKGTCDTINGTNATNHTRLSCLSLCLDTTECRASTYWILTGLCELHECDTMTSSNDTYFTSRTCFDESTSTRQVLFSSGVTASSEHLLSLFTDTVTMTPYFELSGETSAEKNILGSISINRTTNLVMNSSYKPESRNIAKLTHDLTTSPLLTTRMVSGNVSTSRTSLNTLKVEMTKSFWHHAEEFFAQPSNIAVVLAAGGVTVVGIIIVAGCKLAKKTREIVPVAST